MAGLQMHRTVKMGSEWRASGSSSPSTAPSSASGRCSRGGKSRGSGRWRWRSCFSRRLFLAAEFLTPQLVRPLNVQRLELGLLLGWIVAPIVMTLLYVLVVTPSALREDVGARFELE